MNGCIVCGSSAEHTRFRQAPSVYVAPTISLCRAHRFVCDAHLEDPCPICDTDDTT